MSAFYLSIVCSFAQSPQPDSSGFMNRKLHWHEVNFVSGYYHQEGNNSAVTGGIGTEKLTDFANTLNVTLMKTDPKNRIHTYGVEMGIDHYTSASSDQIDPTTISSASSADNRLYPSVLWQMKDEAKCYSTGAGLSISNEFDYFSKGFNVNFNKFSADHNREFGIKLNAFLDTWKIIFPKELRDFETQDGLVSNPDAHGFLPRNTYNGSFSWAQVVNKRLQLAFLTDVAYQSGQLASLYHRVYFSDNSLRVEHLPDSRFKLPVGIRANFFPGDRFILRTFYRFYTDNWGIKAHTFELEVPYKISPFVSISPYYRFYTQTAADYFAPYRQHQTTDEFYTSDYDISDFNSHFGGLNLRFNSPDGMLGINHLNTLEVRYGHYNRSTGLQANIITLAATVK
jgi:hypothetical protein